MMESEQIRKSAKNRLRRQYESMNVAELHRQVEELRNRLFDLMEGKPQQEPARPKRRGPGITVTSRATAIWMQQMMGKKK
jgi:chromatin segregation and condensation protein Rec8/ScpA/Scc1 (kleisin family)